MSSTGGHFEGLPELKRAPAVASPRRLSDDRVCIETVLFYRTKRGFRPQAVAEEMRERYLTEIWEKCDLEILKSL